MSVKSIVELTRNQAERKYYDLLAKLHNDRLWMFSDTELEILLEEMNDKAHDGEGFENYIIVDD